MTSMYDTSGSRSVVVVVVVIALSASLFLAMNYGNPPFLPPDNGTPPTTTTATTTTTTTTATNTTPPLKEYTPHSPIQILSDAEFTTQASEEGWLGNGTYSDPFLIEGLKIVTDTRNCIKIQNVIEHHFIIRDCYFEATHKSFGVCVKIYESENGVVEDCIMVSGYQGMDFFGSSACEIRDCYIGGVGCGINTTIASNITVKGNVVGDCYFGMMIGLADHIDLCGNYFWNCSIGIAAHGSSEILLNDTTVTDNVVGLITEYSCQDWTITRCLFLSNSEVGIDLMETTQLFMIHSNQFGFNNLHARDNGVSNSWDDGIGVGNAWDDYSGSGTYSIPGSAESVDNYPTLYEP